MTDLSLGVVVTADQANAAFRSVNESIRATGTAVRDSAANTRTASQANDSFGTTAAQAAQRIQGMAGQVQSLAGRLGGGSVGQVAGLVGSLAGVTAQALQMGATMGPGGIVVGAIAGLIPLVMQLATAHDTAAQAARNQQQAERDLANASSAALDAQLATGSITGPVDPHDLAVAAQARRITIAENQARIAQLRQLMDDVSDGFAGPIDSARVAYEVAAGGGDGLETQIANLERRTEAAIREVGVAEAALRNGTGSDNGLDTISTGGGPRMGALPTVGDVAAMTGLRSATQSSTGGAPSSQLDEIAEAAREDREVLAAGEAEKAQALAEATHRARELAAADIEKQTQLEERAADSARAHAEAQRELADAADQASHAFSDGYVRSIDQVVAAWTRANQTIRAAGGQMLSTSQLLERGMVAVGNNIAETVGGTMKGAFESALGAWLDGSKSFVQAAEEMAKGVLKALVTEAIVQGVVELARGIADLASYRYDSAGLHFAAAAAWAAVGAVAGGVGAAVGAFGGGGGQQGATSRDTASPDREAQRDQAGSGGNLTLNIYPGGFITKADVDAGVVAALDRADRNGVRPRFARAA